MRPPAATWVPRAGFKITTQVNCMARRAQIIANYGMAPNQIMCGEFFDQRPNYWMVMVVAGW